MSVAHVFLGLLEPAPSHGYTLKQEYDTRFGRSRPLKTGQVYATLQRLQRDGLATVVGTEAGAGPDRKVFAITPDGVGGFERWLGAPESAHDYEQSVIFVKVSLALLSGRPAGQILDAQRRVHLARMRELTRSRRKAELIDRLTADYEIAHLDADLRWMDDAGARLDAWRTELTEGAR